MPTIKRIEEGASNTAKASVIMGAKLEVVAGDGLIAQPNEKGETPATFGNEKKGQASRKSPTDVSDEALLRGWPLYTMMISVVSAVLLVALAGTILGTVRRALKCIGRELSEIQAIPSITDEFHTVDDVGWYASVYLISKSVSLPLPLTSSKHLTRGIVVL